MTGHALFLASLERRAKKDFLGPKLFLKIKIFNFYLQKQLRSDRFSLGTPFFFVENERESRHQAKGMKNSA